MVHNLVGLIREWTSALVIFVFKSLNTGWQDLTTVTSGLIVRIFNELAFTFLSCQVEEVWVRVVFVPLRLHDCKWLLNVLVCLSIVAFCLTVKMVNASSLPILFFIFYRPLIIRVSKIGIENSSRAEIIQVMFVLILCCSLYRLREPNRRSRPHKLLIAVQFGFSMRHILWLPFKISSIPGNFFLLKLITLEFKRLFDGWITAVNLLIAADKQDLYLVAGALISVIIQVLRLTWIAIIYAENFLTARPGKVFINITCLLCHECLFHQDEVSLVVVRNAFDCKLSFFFKITVYFDKDLIRPLVYNFWPASIRTFIL